MPTRRAVIVAMIVGGLALGGGEACAQGPFTKLGRGFANFFGSPAELIVQTAELGKAHDAVTAAFGGFFKGLVFMGARMVTGAYDVATFPLPIPPGYQPVMVPPTVFDALGEAVEWRQ